MTDEQELNGQSQELRVVPDSTKLVQGSMALLEVMYNKVCSHERRRKDRSERGREGEGETCSIIIECHEDRHEVSLPTKTGSPGSHPSTKTYTIVILITCYGSGFWGLRPLKLGGGSLRKHRIIDKGKVSPGPLVLNPRLQRKLKE